MRLGAKLTLWLLMPLLLVLTIFTLVTLRREREVHQSEVRDEARRIANTLAVSVVEAVRRQNVGDIYRIAEESALNRNRFGLVVYDAQGRPIMSWGLAWAAGAVGPQELAAVVVDVCDPPAQSAAEFEVAQ